MDEKWLEQARKLAVRSYFIKVTLDETTENEPIYLAQVPELEGCFGQGGTSESAIADLRNAMVDYIASLLEDGLPIPEPAQLALYTSSSSSKTFTFAKYDTEKRNMPTPHTNVTEKLSIPNPHRNVYMPAG